RAGRRCPSPRFPRSGSLGTRCCARTESHEDDEDEDADQEQEPPLKGALMNDYRKKHVVLTGAASGIGRALALALARKGARVALVDIDRAGLASVLAGGRKLA